MVRNDDRRTGSLKTSCWLYLKRDYHSHRCDHRDEGQHKQATGQRGGADEQR